MYYFPLSQKINGSSCLVGGGGAIAEGKIRQLLKTGARVTVLAPKLNYDSEKLHKQNLFEHIHERCHGLIQTDNNY